MWAKFELVADFWLPEIRNWDVFQCAKGVSVAVTKKGKVYSLSHHLKYRKMAFSINLLKGIIKITVPPCHFSTIS